VTSARDRIKALRARIGRRGAGLLSFGFVDFVFGYSLIDPTARAVAAAQPSYKAMQEILPLAAWGWLWVAVGVVCVGHAFTTRDAGGFMAAIGIKIVWTLAIGASWIVYGAPRAWAGCALWLVVAGLVRLIAGWQEPVQVPDRGRPS
jgi:hypothetical protein